MNKKGNLLITMILLLGIAVILPTFIYLITARVKSSSGGSNRSKAFYTAEAGLNKAIWYLLTPSESGGHGSSWRVSGQVEPFGFGHYWITIFDKDISTVTIIATGEMNGETKTITQDLLKGSSSSSFTNALYNVGNVSMSGNVKINGPVFADGNISLTGNSSIDGTVSISTGHTITGGTATTVSTIPPAPALDTSFYDGKIAQAMLVTAGNMNISGSGTYDLGGGTLYVNGDLSIGKGIIGGGTIVTTGRFSYSGNGNIDANTTIISKNELNISGNGNIASGAIIYSAEDIHISGNGDITGSIISPKGIDASGNGRLIGLIYSGEGMSGETEITGNKSIIGTILGNGTSSFSGNITITYDPASIPSGTPGIVAGTSPLSPIKGTWKEL